MFPHRLLTMQAYVITYMHTFNVGSTTAAARATNGGHLHIVGIVICTFSRGCLTP